VYRKHGQKLMPIEIQNRIFVFNFIPLFTANIINIVVVVVAKIPRKQATCPDTFSWFLIALRPKSK